MTAEYKFYTACYLLFYDL